jgi:hypothetical protein
MAYATTIARLSPLGFYALLLLRLLLEYVVAVWALNKCEARDVAETIRALAEYRHRK